MWQTVLYIGSPLSLVAFLAAVAASILRLKLRSSVQLIESATDDRRAELVAELAETYHIPIHDLPKTERFELVNEVLRQKSERFKITALASVVIALLLAAVVVLLAIVGAQLSNGSSGVSQNPISGVSVIRAEPNVPVSCTLSASDESPFHSAGATNVFSLDKRFAIISRLRLGRLNYGYVEQLRQDNIESTITDPNLAEYADETWELLGTAGEFLQRELYPKFWEIRPESHDDMIYVFRSDRRAVPQTATLVWLNSLNHYRYSDSEQEQNLGREMVRVAKKLWPHGKNDEEKLLRLLLFGNSKAVINANIQNPSNDPVVLTHVQCRVHHIQHYAGALDSGPIEVVSRARIDLRSLEAGEEVVVPLSPTIKIAPKDAVAVALELVSEFSHVYSLSFVFLNGTESVCTSPEFRVDFR